MPLSAAETHQFEQHTDKMIFTGAFHGKLANVVFLSRTTTCRVHLQHDQLVQS